MHNGKIGNIPGVSGQDGMCVAAGDPWISSSHDTQWASSSNVRPLQD